MCIPGLFPTPDVPKAPPPPPPAPIKGADVPVAGTNRRTKERGNLQGTSLTIPTPLNIP